jgi:hypothetical protein
MAYEVEGVIAKRAVLERHALGWMKIAPLNQGYGLVPINKDAHPFLERLYREGYAAFLRDFRNSDAEIEGKMASLNYLHDYSALWLALRGWLSETSRDGPVAAIWVECFGGDCIHGAVVFQGGECTHGPAVMESSDLQFDNPVNQALRAIGVEVGVAYDAFAAIGLSAHRSRDDWEAVAV